MSDYLLTITKHYATNPDRLNAGLGLANSLQDEFKQRQEFNAENKRRESEFKAKVEADNRQRAAALQPRLVVKTTDEGWTTEEEPKESYTRFLQAQKKKADYDLESFGVLDEITAAFSPEKAERIKAARDRRDAVDQRLASVLATEKEPLERTWSESLSDKAKGAQATVYDIVGTAADYLDSDVTGLETKTADGKVVPGASKQGQVLFTEGVDKALDLAIKGRDLLADLGGFNPRVYKKLLQDTLPIETYKKMSEDKLAEFRNLQVQENERRAKLGLPSIQEENDAGLGNQYAAFARESAKEVRNDRSLAAKVDDARLGIATQKGAGAVLEEAVTNPGAIVDKAIESAPYLAAGGPATSALRRLGMSQAAATTGGVMAIGALDTAQGAQQAKESVSAADMAELAKSDAFQKLKAANPKATPAQLREVLAMAAEDRALAVGLPINAALAVVSTKLGLNPVEEAVSGVAKKVTPLGAVGSVVKEAIGEFPEEAANQWSQNLGEIAGGVRAPDKEMEGVVGAGTIGSLTGGATAIVTGGAQLAAEELTINKTRRNILDAEASPDTVRASQNAPGAAQPQAAPTAPQAAPTSAETRTEAPDSPLSAEEIEAETFQDLVPTSFFEERLDAMSAEQDKSMPEGKAERDAVLSEIKNNYRDHIENGASLTPDTKAMLDSIVPEFKKATEPLTDMDVKSGLRQLLKDIYNIAEAGGGRSVGAVNDAIRSRINSVENPQILEALAARQMEMAAGADGKLAQSLKNEADIALAKAKAVREDSAVPQAAKPQETVQAAPQPVESSSIELTPRSFAEVLEERAASTTPIRERVELPAGSLAAEEERTGRPPESNTAGKQGTPFISPVAKKFKDMSFFEQRAIAKQLRDSTSALELDAVLAGIAAGGIMLRNDPNGSSEASITRDAKRITINVAQFTGKELKRRKAAAKKLKKQYETAASKANKLNKKARQQRLQHFFLTNFAAFLQSSTSFVDPLRHELTHAKDIIGNVNLLELSVDMVDNPLWSAAGMFVLENPATANLSMKDRLLEQNAYYMSALSGLASNPQYASLLATFEDKVYAPLKELTTFMTSDELLNHWNTVLDAYSTGELQSNTRGTLSLSEKNKKDRLSALFDKAMARKQARDAAEPKKSYIKDNRPITPSVRESVELEETEGRQDTNILGSVYSPSYIKREAYSLADGLSSSYKGAYVAALEDILNEMDISFSKNELPVYSPEGKNGKEINALWGKSSRLRGRVYGTAGVAASAAEMNEAASSGIRFGGAGPAKSNIEVENLLGVVSSLTEAEYFDGTDAKLTEFSTAIAAAARDKVRKLLPKYVRALSSDYSKKLGAAVRAFNKAAKEKNEESIAVAKADLAKIKQLIEVANTLEAGAAPTPAMLETLAPLHNSKSADYLPMDLSAAIALAEEGVKVYKGETQAKDFLSKLYVAASRPTEGVEAYRLRITDEDAAKMLKAVKVGDKYYDLGKAVRDTIMAAGKNPDKTIGLQLVKYTYDTLVALSVANDGATVLPAFVTKSGNRLLGGKFPSVNSTGVFEPLVVSSDVVDLLADQTFAKMYYIASGIKYNKNNEATHNLDLNMLALPFSLLEKEIAYVNLETGAINKEMLRSGIVAERRQAKITEPVDESLFEQGDEQESGIFSAAESYSTDTKNLDSELEVQVSQYKKDILLVSDAIEAAENSDKDGAAFVKNNHQLLDLLGLEAYDVDYLDIKKSLDDKLGELEESLDVTEYALDSVISASYAFDRGESADIDFSSYDYDIDLSSLARPQYSLPTGMPYSGSDYVKVEGVDILQAKPEEASQSLVYSWYSPKGGEDALMTYAEVKAKYRSKYVTTFEDNQKRLQSYVASAISAVVEGNANPRISIPHKLAKFAKDTKQDKYVVATDDWDVHLIVKDGAISADDAVRGKSVTTMYSDIPYSFTVPNSFSVEQGELQSSTGSFSKIFKNIRTRVAADDINALTAMIADRATLSAFSTAAQNSAFIGPSVRNFVNRKAHLKIASIKLQVEGRLARDSSIIGGKVAKLNQILDSVGMSQQDRTALLDALVVIDESYTIQSLRSINKNAIVSRYVNQYGNAIRPAFDLADTLRDSVDAAVQRLADATLGAYTYGTAPMNLKKSYDKLLASKRKYLYRTYHKFSISSGRLWKTQINAAIKSIRKAGPTAMPNSSTHSAKAHAAVLNAADTIITSWNDFKDKGIKIKHSFTQVPENWRAMNDDVKMSVVLDMFENDLLAAAELEIDNGSISALSPASRNSGALKNRKLDGPENKVFRELLGENRDYGRVISETLENQTVITMHLAMLRQMTNMGLIVDKNTYARMTVTQRAMYAPVPTAGIFSAHSGSYVLKDYEYAVTAPKPKVSIAQSISDFVAAHRAGDYKGMASSALLGSYNAIATAFGLLKMFTVFTGPHLWASLFVGGVSFSAKAAAYPLVYVDAFEIATLWRNNQAGAPIDKNHPLYDKYQFIMGAEVIDSAVFAEIATRAKDSDYEAALQQLDTNGRLIRDMGFKTAEDIKDYLIATWTKYEAVPKIAAALAHRGTMQEYNDAQGLGPVEPSKVGEIVRREFPSAKEVPTLAKFFDSVGVTMFAGFFYQTIKAGSWGIGQNIAEGVKMYREANNDAAKNASLKFITRVLAGSAMQFASVVALSYILRQLFQMDDDDMDEEQKKAKLAADAMFTTTEDPDNMIHIGFDKNGAPIYVDVTMMINPLDVRDALFRRTFDLMDPDSKETFSEIMVDQIPFGFVGSAVRNYMRGMDPGKNATKAYDRLTNAGIMRYINNVDKFGFAPGDSPFPVEAFANISGIKKVDPVERAEFLSSQSYFAVKDLGEAVLDVVHSGDSYNVKEIADELSSDIDAVKRKFGAYSDTLNDAMHASGMTKPEFIKYMTSGMEEKKAAAVSKDMARVLTDKKGVEYLEYRKERAVSEIEDYYNKEIKKGLLSTDRKGPLYDASSYEIAAATRNKTSFEALLTPKKLYPPVTGTVYGVHDADTVYVKDQNGYQIKVRLQNIDAFELDQMLRDGETPIGKQGQEYLSALLINQQVTLYGYGYDNNGRYIARVETKDGKDAGLLVAEEGYAILTDIGDLEDYPTRAEELDADAPSVARQRKQADKVK